MLELHGRLAYEYPAGRLTALYCNLNHIRVRSFILSGAPFNAKARCNSLPAHSLALLFADEAFGLVLQTNHGSKRTAPGMPEYSVRVPRRSNSAHPRRSWCAKLPPFRKLRSTCPCRINRNRPAGRGKPTTSPSPSNAIARVRRS